MTLTFLPVKGEPWVTMDVAGNTAVFTVNHWVEMWPLEHKWKQAYRRARARGWRWPGA